MEGRVLYDLEERLVDFSVMIINLAKKIPDSQVGRHLSGQIIRSGTSASLNYGEAQSAESRKDFIHKMKIVLKELRETSICLLIIIKADLMKSVELIESIRKENQELIAIIYKSIETARKNAGIN